MRGWVIVWVVAALLESVARAELLHVSVVFRHAVRTHLSKNTDLENGESSGSRLLQPEGTDQARALGKIVRERYVTTDVEDMKLKGVRELYQSETDLRIVTSNFQRSAATAAGFAEGLYPEQAVPVLVHRVPESDFLMRAYDKCPVYTKRLETLYASEEFTSRADEESEFLEKWSAGYDESADLENWINVYDQYNLAMNYDGHRGLDVDNPGNGVSIADVSNDDFDRMRDLATFTEEQRYSEETAQFEVGARLAGEIISEMENVVNGNPSSRISAFAGHYPSLLSLVAALQGPSFGKIPEFSDAIVVELHERGVRLGHLEASRSGEVDFLEMSGCPEDQVYCPLTSLASSLNGKIARDDATACKLCENTDAPICAASDQQANPGGDTGSGGEGSCEPCEPSESCDPSGTSPALAGVIGAIAGIASTALLFAAVVVIRRRRRAQAYAAHNNLTKDGFVGEA